MRPKQLMNFAEILSCSAKYDKDSVKNVSQRIRKVLDLCSDDLDENKLANLHNTLKDQLYDKKIKLT